MNKLKKIRSIVNNHLLGYKAMIRKSRAGNSTVLEVVDAKNEWVASVSHAYDKFFLEVKGGQHLEISEREIIHHTLKGLLGVKL